jgi:hypothetical protein
MYRSQNVASTASFTVGLSPLLSTISLSIHFQVSSYVLRPVHTSFLYWICQHGKKKLKSINRLLLQILFIVSSGNLKILFILSTFTDGRKSKLFNVSSLVIPYDRKIYVIVDTYLSFPVLERIFGYKFFQ